MLHSRATSELPGQEKFGRFFLRERLNTGGMAEIWLVSDHKGKPFALRRLKSELRFNFTARRRFARGNDILSQISGNEHIIGYVEHGRDYLLMDYVEARNLKELLALRDPVLAENLAQIILDMADGLSHIHATGFMHLDFKPENVLVTPNAAVRLIDFDLAQPIPKQPIRQAQNPGTPGYMAPEQLQHEPLDARADIFAFGVAAYELLTGHKPFPGESPAEILAAQLHGGGPVPMREHYFTVPEKLEAVVLKCLECDRERRYENSAILLLDLQQALYV